MCSKNEYTKSESNSQLGCQSGQQGQNCVQRTNIQNLKAIHNGSLILVWNWLIVFKERIYKIWKQFTTMMSHLSCCAWLCSKNEYTKSESNSQPPRWWPPVSTNCVQRTNIQNLKAIHNDYTLTDDDWEIVFKERIYKIWKQFTTLGPHLLAPRTLCSKNEYTKSESNSQLNRTIMQIDRNCVQRTNIQNLKAIHNTSAKKQMGQNDCVQRTNIQNPVVWHFKIRKKLKIFDGVRSELFFCQI